MLPRIKSGLAAQDFGAEFLVYDSVTEKAHYLSRVGATVFAACKDGATREDLLVTLAQIDGVENPEVVLDETLHQLHVEGLLPGDTEEGSSFDRRRFLEAAGKIAALPIVASVLAPKPAAAQSCRNCTVIGAFPGTPDDCTDCGRPCPDGVGCSAAARCCFEYRLVTTNGGSGIGCVPGEILGAFGCRTPAQGGFACDCGTSRDNAIAFNNTTGTLYYCCTCAGQTANLTCATCTP